MTITERTSGPITILDLDGRMVFGDGDQTFKEHVNALVRQGRKLIVLNMKGVTYLDSAGVGVLVWKFVTIRKQGGTIKLASLSQRSHNVMHISKLLEVFETYESEEEAIRSFNPAQAKTGAFTIAEE